MQSDRLGAQEEASKSFHCAMLGLVSPTIRTDEADESQAIGVSRGVGQLCLLWLSTSAAGPTELFLFPSKSTGFHSSFIPLSWAESTASKQPLQDSRPLVKNCCTNISFMYL